MATEWPRNGHGMATECPRNNHGVRPGRGREGVELERRVLVKNFIRTGVLGGFILTLIVVFTAGVTTLSAQVQDQTQASPVCTLEDGSCGCDPEFQDCGCTSIQVAKLASTDGSVMTAHSCDGNYRTWLQIEPERKNPPGSMRPIYWGLLHTETPDDLRRVTLKGQIPEVAETY